MAKTFKEYLEDFGSLSLFGFDSKTGQIIPQTSTLKDVIKSMMNNIFNQELSIEDETPAGRICEAWAIQIARFCSVTAAYANQINPNYATGQMLDAVGSIFSISRSGASSAVISISITGTAGVTIPSGALIRDNIGNEFTVLNSVTIPAGGSVSARAVCTKTGVLSVENGTVTEIVSTIPGWMAVSNTGMILPGSEIETDEHFRDRILMSRWTGTSFTEAIQAGIKRQKNVDSVIVIENGDNGVRYYTEDKELVENEPTSGKYIKLDAHSVCIIVYGSALSASDYSAIAQSIYSTKSAGCAYTSLDAETQGEAKGVKVLASAQDQISGSTYQVVFNTPIHIPFSCSASVVRGSYNGTNEELISDVKEAILAWSRGESSIVDGPSLGGSLFAFEIGAAISDAIPSILVKDVAILVDGATETSHDLFIYEVGSIDIDNITVTVS